MEFRRVLFRSIDVTEGEGGDGFRQPHVEDRLGIGVEIIAAEDAGEGAVVVDELDFLRELLVLVNGGHVEIDGGEGIEVDRRTAFIGAPGADAAESQRIRHLRSEEHTSELQSLMRISYAVFCLKTKNKKNKPIK